jgi:hypothetical protein
MSQRSVPSKIHEPSPEDADSDSNSESHSAEEGTPTPLLPQARRSLRNRSENEESSGLVGSSGNEQDILKSSQTKDKKVDAKPKPKARTSQRRSNRLNTG